MSGKHGSQDDLLERIHGFVVAGERNELGDDGWRDFERLLREDDNACRLYAEYMDVSIFLPTILEMVPDEDPLSSTNRFPEQPTALPWTPGFLGNVAPSATGYLSGWPVAYLVATVILGIGMLVGASVHVSTPGQVVRQAVANRSPLAPSLSSRMQFVGRITGMVDCQWERKGLGIRDWGLDGDTGGRGQGPGKKEFQSPIPNPQSLVSLGDTFALASGLLEIAYDTGARVILQGPATYEVESAAGGFLSLGKLTAKLEKRSEIRDQRPEIRNQKSPDLWPLTSDLFAIRTPTATVTDLGTEFGVEVWPDRPESVVVFQGQVQVAVCSKQGDASQTQTLQAGQSAQIDGKTATVVVGNAPAEGKKPFVRSLRASAALPPADIAASENLVLWLKADAIRGLGDGASVGMWPDSSTRHNHMYHATATLPIYVAGVSSGLNKMPVVRFDGTDQFCGMLDTDPRTPGVQTLKTPFTLLSVARNTDRSGITAVRGYFGGGEFRMAFGMNSSQFDPKNSFWAWAPFVVGTCTFGQADSLNSDWNVHTYTLNDLTPQHWTGYCNGKAISNSGLNLGTPQQYDERVYIGGSGSGSECWMGDVAELLVYDRVLTQRELHQVGSYLGRKYGIDTAWVILDSAEKAETNRNTTREEALPMEKQ